MPDQRDFGQETLAQEEALARRAPERYGLDSGSNPPFERSPIVDAPLSAVEVRILGALIEKKITTPEYYPLSLNALVLACNQSTNRDPVSDYDEGTIGRTLEGLRQKGLAWVVSGGRVPKFEHRFGEKFRVAGAELAAMCVLMLRGAQTPGEIRGRSGRLHEFAGLPDVETALETLMRAEPPLVTRLPRLPGTKESRFAHLLGGSVAAADSETAAHAAAPPVERPESGDRVARLEREVESLRAEIHDLRRELEELKSGQT